MFNVNEIRKDFPILSRTVNGKPLVYFDNGATAQKPQVVIDAISHYYSFQNSNIHRGVHTLSREITIAYEESRKTIQLHLNAKQASEIIFTKGGDRFANEIPEKVVCESLGIKIVDGLGLKTHYSSDMIK